MDLYGGVPDYDALRTIAEEHGLLIVEDAAEAIGSESDGRKAGRWAMWRRLVFMGPKLFRLVKADVGDG